VETKKTENEGREEVEGRRDKRSDEQREIPKNIAEARETTLRMVRESTPGIVAGLITAAKGGQVASAKYLFELAGLYPAVNDTSAEEKEESLAYTLLKRLGLDTDGLDEEETAPGSVRGERVEWIP
jgi:hypothetical protein